MRSPLVIRVQELIDGEVAELSPSCGQLFVDCNSNKIERRALRIDRQSFDRKLPHSEKITRHRLIVDDCDWAPDTSVHPALPVHTPSVSHRILTTSEPITADVTVEQPTPAVEAPKKSISKRRLFLFAYVMWWIVIFALHVPLPDNITDRRKMIVVDHFMRWIYRYPLVHLQMVGAFAQVYFQRYTFKTLAFVMSPWRGDAALEITDVVIRDVPVRMYLPHDRVPHTGAIIFVHGGGFAIGNIALYESYARELATRTNLVTLSIEYRLAPEHRFPAGLNDVENVVTEFLKSGAIQMQVDPRKVVIMGDSAGGNLATVVARHIRDQVELPKLMSQVLLYPLVQFHDFKLPSYQEYFRDYEFTAFVDPFSIARSLLFYSGVDPTDRHISAILNNSHLSFSPQLAASRLSHEHLPTAFRVDAPVMMANEHVDYEVAAALEPFLSNPDISPLMSDDLAGSPPAFVLTCQFDVLRDEGYLYAEHLKSHGVPVRYSHYPTGFHAMINLHKDITAARDMLNEIVDYVNEIMAT